MNINSLQTYFVELQTRSYIDTYNISLIRSAYRDYEDVETLKIFLDYSISISEKINDAKYSLHAELFHLNMMKILH